MLCVAVGAVCAVVSAGWWHRSTARTAGTGGAPHTDGYVCLMLNFTTPATAATHAAALASKLQTLAATTGWDYFQRAGEGAPFRFGAFSFSG